MTSTTYISIDVAVRSLAIGVFRMKPFRDIDTYKNVDPQTWNSAMDEIIHPITIRVFDLNAGQNTKDTTAETKAIALKTALTELDETNREDLKGRVCVLVEYQLNANYTANSIFNMLVYHYAGRYPVEIIKPAHKNTVYLHPRLTLSAFLATASSNYVANKQHTKHNLLYFLTMIGRLDMLEGVAKRNWDDAADTLMMAIWKNTQRTD